MHVEALRDRLVGTECQLGALRERVEGLAAGLDKLRDPFGGSGGQRFGRDGIAGLGSRVEVLEAQLRRGFAGAFSEPRLDELHGRIDALATRLLAESRRLDERLDDVVGRGPLSVPPSAAAASALVLLASRAAPGSRGSGGRDGRVAGALAANALAAGLGRGLETLAEESHITESDGESMHQRMSECEQRLDALEFGSGLPSSFQVAASALPGSGTTFALGAVSERFLEDLDESLANVRAELGGRVEALASSLADLGTKFEDAFWDDLSPQGLERDLLEALRRIGYASGKEPPDSGRRPRSDEPLGSGRGRGRCSIGEGGTGEARCSGDDAFRARSALRRLSELEDSIAALPLQLTRGPRGVAAKSAGDVVRHLRSRVSSIVAECSPDAEAAFGAVLNFGMDLPDTQAQSLAGSRGGGGDPLPSNLQEMRWRVDELLQGKLMARQLAKCIRWLQSQLVGREAGGGVCSGRLAEDLSVAEGALRELRGELSDGLEDAMAALQEAIQGFAMQDGAGHEPASVVLNLHGIGDEEQEAPTSSRS